MCYEVTYYLEKAKEMKERVARPKKNADGTLHWSPVSSSASSVRSFKSFMSGSSRTGNWSNPFSKKDSSPGTPPTPQSPPPVLNEFFCLFPECKYATDRKGDLETHVKFAHNLAQNGRKRSAAAAFKSQEQLSNGPVFKRIN